MVHVKRDFIVLAKSGSLNHAPCISLVERLRLISHPHRVLRDWISSELWLDEEQPSDGRIRACKLITTEIRYRSQTCLNPASHVFDAHHPNASDQFPRSPSIFFPVIFISSWLKIKCVPIVKLLIIPRRLLISQRPDID